MRGGGGEGPGYGAEKRKERRTRRVRGRKGGRERKGNILSLRRTRDPELGGFRRRRGGGREERGDGKGRCGKRAEIGGGLRGGERRGAGFHPGTH